ncbi:MAG: cytochrome-c peroxidase [Bryobacterales bacterium]|nr:cytochrome-c peroxidase [Bryobacterales bacterium]
MKPVLFILALALIALPGSAQKSAEVPEGRLRIFKPLPASMDSSANPPTAAKIQLGRMLYFEPRLSKSQTISCNSCHMLDTYGVDNKPTSDGHRGLKGDRNSPTVYNAALHLSQFWDGRSPDVEDQAKGPVMNPVEMAMPSEGQVLAVLKSMPEYVSLFKQAFPGEADPVTFDNFALAVGAFERKLVTPSRWDRFLSGDAAALTAQEKAGLKTFLDSGCATCHSGVGVGGHMYQKLGIAKPWPDQSDLGRYQATKAEKDKLYFKVPSLRNIDRTGPYYHHGKIDKLKEAVFLMAEFELGKQLNDSEAVSIVTFLKALTGELPAEYIQPPALPKRTAQTPKPVTGE